MYIHIQKCIYIYIYINVCVYIYICICIYALGTAIRVVGKYCLFGYWESASSLTACGGSCLEDP